MQQNISLYVGILVIRSNLVIGFRMMLNWHKTGFTRPSSLLALHFSILNPSFSFFLGYSSERDRKSYSLRLLTELGTLFSKFTHDIDKNGY